MPYCRQALQSCVALLLLCAVAGTVHAGQVDINAVRVWRAPDNTRLVFDLSGPVEHRIFTLQSPERLVIDISNARMRTSTDNVDLAKSPVQRICTGVQDQTSVRVVLDLASGVKPRSFVLKPNDTYGDRLVLDLYDVSANAATNEPVKTAETTVSQQRDIVIAIDAGHGGEDPGAIGPGRVREKDVVMAIAKEIEARFQAEKGYKPVLVRAGDYYIPLERRRDIAREKRADFFVSIHADAFTKPSARGASVFTVSDRGATSTMGRFLAEKENAADLVGGVSLGEMDHQLRQVMLDLSMTHTQRSGLDAGAEVLSRMGRMTHLHSRKVEQAGFAVLKNPDIPSLLVETGFISNPEEARLLNSSSHRRKLGDAIFSGISAYFEKSPPDGTYLAWKMKSPGNRQTSYTIQRGDTLSGVASRFSISVASLKQANGMSSDRLHIGQTLQIPSS